MRHVTLRAALLLGPLVFLGTRALTAQEAHPAWEWSFHGVVLMNAFYNDNRVSSNDLPATVLAPVAPPSLPGRSTGANIRQSRLTGMADLAGFAGGDLHTELDVDFYSPAGADWAPVPRVRRAFGEVTWARTTLLVGQEAPLVADVSPVSLATIAFPGYSSAGNLWLWIPQLRVGYDLGSGRGARVGLQAALLSPNTEAPFAVRPEHSTLPMAEARIRVRWGDRGEIGLGGHFEQVATTGDSTLQAKGVVVSGVVPLGAVFELRGEGFTGQGLADLGGGGVGQGLNLEGAPLKSTGGWAQLNAKAGPRWELGAGFGVDDPRGSTTDKASTAFKDRNAQYGGRVQWRHAPAVVALEYRHLATTYGGGIGERTATHLNLAMGVEF